MVKVIGVSVEIGYRGSMQNTFAWAAMLAGLGAVAGALVGGVRGAVIGAMIGGALGALIGYMLDAQYLHSYSYQKNVALYTTT
jgi:outer membrane lipoprotein SlyB